MKKLIAVLGYFTRFELILWLSSLVFITISFLVFDRSSFLTLVASLVGATALIFCAKGNPIGQALIIIFSILYGIISYSFAYFGEMITYLGMSMPMAVLALISWIRNPYGDSRSEVKIGRLGRWEIPFLLILAAAVTVGFHFILKVTETANLLPSTLSVTTSFIAVYLTFRRSPFYALAYAFNDIVLIVLWVLATISNISYISVVICFLMFLINDLYSFVNWLRMKRRQTESRVS